MQLWFLRCSARADFGQAANVKNMNIFCLGDSHTRYFKKANTLAWSGILSRTSPSVTAFDYVAASAKGFAAGPTSRFAYRSFRRDYEANCPDFICLGYGQVDAEMGFYFRKFVKGYTGSAEADLSGVFDAYIQMAEATVKTRPLVFKGPNPSTLRIDIQLLTHSFQRLVVRITDTEERKVIWTAMNERPPSVTDHAMNNCTAAAILKSKVEKAGHIYFDIRSEVEDSATPGMARWEHVPAISDVHLCDSFHVRKAHADRLFGVFEGLQVTRVE